MRHIICHSMHSRPASLTLTRSLLLLISYIPALHSRPTGFNLFGHEDIPEEPWSGAFWWKVGISLVLVLLGGVFAGLTLALLSQDEITVCPVV